MTPEEFTRFEDEKAIDQMKKAICELIDQKDPYHVMSALHEIYFGMIPYYVEDPKKFLLRIAKDCTEKAKTAKHLTIKVEK